MSGQEGCHDALVLDGRDRARRVHEGTAAAQRPRSGGRGCPVGAARAPPGRPALRQRASGRLGERAEVTARRVDEDAVELSRAAARAASAVRTSTMLAPMRSRGPAQRLGAAGVLLDGDDLALVAHQRREVGGLAAGGGAQVEHALARLGRERARRRPSRRVTAASAGPAPTRARRRCRRASSRISASGSSGTVCAGRRWASSSAVVRSVLARSAASAGSLSAAIRAFAAVAAPKVSHHRRAIHSGCECFSAACFGVDSGSAATSGRASLTARRRTALTRPAPRGASALASSTDSPTAACAGMRSRKVSWKTPSRSAARTGASSFGDRPAGQALDHVVERGHALDGAEAQLRGQREVARVQPRAASPRRAAHGRPTRPARTRVGRPRTRTRATAATLGRGTDGWSSFGMPAFTGAGKSDWLCAAIRARAGLRARARTEVQIPVSFLKFGSGLLCSPFPHVLERSSKNRSTGSIHPKRANGPRTTCRHPPWKGMPHMSDTDNTYAMTARNARPTALGDLRFAGTIATGLVAGTLGLGAIALPLVGWKDWPQGLTQESANSPVQLAKLDARAGNEQPNGTRVSDPTRGGGAAPIGIGLPARRRRRRRHASSASAPARRSSTSTSDSRRDDPRREPAAAAQLAEPAHADDARAPAAGRLRRSAAASEADDDRRRRRPGRLRGEHGRQPGRVRRRRDR